MPDFTKQSLLMADTSQLALQARPLSSLLVNRKLKAVGFQKPPVRLDPDNGGPAIPVGLVNEDHVVAGRIYEASDGGTGFALPTYTLEVVDGRHTSSLRWRKPEDDQNGPLAFFTLRFTVAPAQPGVREIPHQLTARLTHRVAVSDAADQGATLSTVLGALSRTSPSSAEIRYAITTKADFDSLWQAITAFDRPATVELSGTVDVGRRTWVSRPWILPLEVMFTAPPLVKQVHTPPRPDPVEIIPTIPKFPVLRVPIGPLRELQPQWQAVPTLKRFNVRQLATPLMATPFVVDPTVATGLRMDQLRPGLTTLRRRDDDGGPGPVWNPPDNNDAPPIQRPPVIISDEPESIIVPVTLPATGSIGPFAFPVETNAYMFDVPGDLRPQTTRLLIRQEFQTAEGEKPLVYYQDTAFANRYYYEPQQFRVPRNDASPYLPMVVIAFSSVEITSGDGQPAVRYDANLRYQAVPDLDASVLAGLRRHLAEKDGVTGADLTALLPERATVRLMLPDDEAGGALVAVDHELGSNAFDDGFSDEIVLSSTELAAAISLLQTDAVRGTIVADLVGAGRTDIPIELSLRDTPAVPMQHAYRGPVGDGNVRVSVTNPIESPVRIVELYRSTPAAGVSAFPQSNPNVLIPAQGSTDLVYRLAPTDADVDDVSPALRAVVETDLPALLPHLLVNSGFSSQAFPVTVATDAANFGQSPSPELGPLTAIVVQFACDVTVTLDAAHPQVDTELRMPILPWLLKSPDAEQYQYRVSNYHGTADQAVLGAVTELTDGAGRGTLTVAPAGS